MSHTANRSQTPTQVDKYTLVDIALHTDGSESWCVRSSGHTFSEAFSVYEAIDRINLKSDEMDKSILIVHDHVVTDIGEMYNNADHLAWDDWDDDDDTCLYPTSDGYACGSCANCYDFLNQWEIKTIRFDAAETRIPDKDMSFDDLYTLADSFNFLDVAEQDANHPDQLRAAALLEVDNVTYVVTMSRANDNAIADDEDNTSWNIISVDERKP